MSLLILFDKDEELSTDISIVGVNVLSRRLVQLEFTEEVVTSPSYYNIDNYSLTLTEGTQPVEVLEIMPVNGTTSLDIIIRTQPMVPLSRFDLSISGLSVRNGLTFSVIGDFFSRDTKTDSLLRSIPQHYDKRPQSNLYKLLTAIGKVDDKIGGSRSDDIGL